MTDPRSDDERFAELIASEFAMEAGPGPAPREPSPDAAVGAPPRPSSPEAAPAEVTAEPFRSWTPEEEPEEDYVPPTLSPARPWHHLTVLGAVLVAFGLLTVTISAFGVRLPLLVAVLAGASVFSGTALLLYRLSQQPPDDSDGAVV